MGLQWRLEWDLTMNNGGMSSGYPGNMSHMKRDCSPCVSLQGAGQKLGYIIHSYGELCPLSERWNCTSRWDKPTAVTVSKPF